MNVWETLEEKFNILSHQKNAIQNYFEILIPIRIAKINFKNLATHAGKHGQ